MIEDIIYNIDFSEKRASVAPSESTLTQVNQYDHGGAKIKLLLTEDEAPIDLTGYEIVLNIKTKLGKESRVLMDGNADGSAEYVLSKSETSDTGIVSCSVSLYKDGYRRTANVYFYFLVLEDLVSDDSDIVEHDEYSLLSQLIERFHSVLNNEDDRNLLFEQKQAERDEAFELVQQQQLDLFIQQMGLLKDDYQEWRDSVANLTVITAIENRLTALEEAVNNSVQVSREDK